MRRTVLAALGAGALLLSASACGSTTTADAGATAGATAAPAATVSVSPSADYTADSAKVCAEVEKLLKGKELEKFAEEVGKLIVYKEQKLTSRATKARTAAGTRLQALATALRDDTAVAKDPELRDAGAESADAMVASAGDDAFFAKIKKVKDLDTVLESEMTAWLTPVVTICS
jgi:Rieske Fe-S protein